MIIKNFKFKKKYFKVNDANKYLNQQDAVKYITSHAMYTPINMDKETGIRKKTEFTMDILNNKN